MRKLDKKQKIIIFLLAFLIITPIIVLYILNENGVFDTRSSASGVLSERLAKADLNGDDKITISDFSIWLTSYRAFKENNSVYTQIGDLDGDGSIKISDFTTWLTLWREYKTPAPISNSAPTAPTIPMVDGVGNNQAVVISAKPGFSAIFNDPDTGDSSTKYRIQINTKADFTGTSMWDSGQKTMTKTNVAKRTPELEYAGTTALVNGSGYYWRIKFWDVAGHEGAWSAAAAFRMAGNTTPREPQVNHIANPNPLTDTTPGFSAIFNNSDAHNAKYYQIQVNTNSSFTGTVMWDSTKKALASAVVKGTRCPEIQYGGASLSLNGNIYYWRIKFWDTEDHESTWSGGSAWFVMGGSNSAPTAATALQVEEATNPTSVSDTTPEFSAIFNDPNAGDNSNYYQIQVNTKSDFTGTKMWDSGKKGMTITKTGNRSPQISYAGTALTLNGSTYYWRIKFWDLAGKESPWPSGSAWFRMGTGGTQSKFGTGVDGVCTVSGDLNINTGSCTSSREYGDAVNFSVTGNVASGSTSITLAADPRGLAVKDEILIINLKGTSSNYSNVGKFETAVIKSISGKVLTLNSGISNSYDGTTQKIMVQRIPQYTNVTVNDGAKFYPSAWNGSTGGVLMFRANGTVTVKGLIHANGLGYKGGVAPTTDSGGGAGGESFAGMGGDGGANNRSGYVATCGGGGGSGGTGSTGGNGTSNLGGAGGGGGGAQGNAKNGSGGGGAGGGYGGIGLKGHGSTDDAISGSQNASGKGGSGHSYPPESERVCGERDVNGDGKIDGTDCETVTYNISSGGAGGGGGSYGIADLSKIYFGSGGGAGGRGAYYGNSGGKGGNGGGIIYIYAKTLTVTGVISSNGQSGEGGGNNIGGSGGGGAGGSVKLIVDTATLGTSLVRALEGKNGGGTMYGGDGGEGRIRIEYVTSITGTTSPAASTEKKN